MFRYRISIHVGAFFFLFSFWGRDARLGRVSLPSKVASGTGEGAVPVGRQNFILRAELLWERRSYSAFSLGAFAPIYDSQEVVTYENYNTPGA